MCYLKTEFVHTHTHKNTLAFEIYFCSNQICRFLDLIVPIILDLHVQKIPQIHSQASVAQTHSPSGPVVVSVSLEPWLFANTEDASSP